MVSCSVADHDMAPGISEVLAQTTVVPGEQIQVSSESNIDRKNKKHSPVHLIN